MGTAVPVEEATDLVSAWLRWGDGLNAITDDARRERRAACLKNAILSKD
jgi:hypothetical protein